MDTLLWMDGWMDGWMDLSLCLNREPRHEGVLGEWRYSSTHF